jgi:hypothetical protein
MSLAVSWMKIVYNRGRMKVRDGRVCRHWDGGSSGERINESKRSHSGAYR